MQGVMQKQHRARITNTAAPAGMRQHVPHAPGPSGSKHALSVVRLVRQPSHPAHDSLAAWLLRQAQRLPLQLAPAAQQGAGHGSCRWHRTAYSRDGLTIRADANEPGKLEMNAYPLQLAEHEQAA